MSSERTTTGVHAAAPIDPATAPVAEVAANGVPPLDRTRTPLLSSEVGEIVFEILVAVMWSDGELASGEVERGRAAADLMRIRPKRGGALGAIADGSLPFPAIAFERLDPYGRRLAYAAACWLDDASDDPSERRKSFIGAVRTKLDLNDELVERLRHLASRVGNDTADVRDAFAALMRQA